MNFYATFCLAVFIWICVPAVKGSPHSLGVLFVSSSQHNSIEALDGAQEAIKDVQSNDLLLEYKLEIIDSKVHMCIVKK